MNQQTLKLTELILNKKVDRTIAKNKLYSEFRNCKNLYSNPNILRKVSSHIIKNNDFKNVKTIVPCNKKSIPLSIYLSNFLDTPLEFYDIVTHSDNDNLLVINSCHEENTLKKLKMLEKHEKYIANSISLLDFNGKDRYVLDNFNHIYLLDFTQQ